MISANGPEYHRRLNIFIDEVSARITVSVVSDLKNICLKLGIIYGVQNISVSADTGICQIKGGFSHKVDLGYDRRIIMFGKCSDVCICENVLRAQDQIL